MQRNGQMAMTRPRLGAGRPRSTFGLSCKEISLPVNPMTNHIPLNQLLGVKTEKAKKSALPTLAANTTGLSTEAAPKVATVPAPPVARPRFGPVGAEEAGELCQMCNLPLGDLGYFSCGSLLHGECKAQLILKDMQKADEARLKKDAALKRERRAKYDLGWKLQRIPRNKAHAATLGCGGLPQGLCALAWRGEEKTLAVVPTADPAASINLEYLSLALRVRKQDGREPMFSLDPKIDATASKHKLWQVKRFEPAWLDGTSLGEVMFQADYHLKELSMGEYSQPVLGMRSCFDYSEEQGLEKEWSAREWFVVNKAEIQVSKDGVMIPRVQMGVEARETIRTEHGLEDVPMTRPDHPLVQYADAFTHNFELIAERKSVVHHLRELAKATVLAKFVVENNASLGEEWFNLADMSAGPSAHKEIPQLWNEQRTSQIQVEDGRIVSSVEGVQCASTMHGVYGGVEMGIDQMQRVGVPVGRVPTAKVSMARAPALSQRLIQARTGLAEMPLEVPGAAPGVPKGVDLNLDKFDLDGSAAAEPEAPEGSWAGEEFIGRAFWKNLTGSAFKEEDRAMLKDLFNPNMCDRREDCDLFVPPDTSLSHVRKLRALIKEEAAVKQQRKDRFLSREFSAERDVALFPGWRAPMAVAGAQAGAPAARHARPELVPEAANMVKHAVPSFCKSTEDGARFRIYQLGSLEVRSVQEPGSEEAVGAVFSSQEPGRAPASLQGNWSTIAKTDRVAKAVLYIEQLEAAQSFFVSLETDQGDCVMVEALSDGSLALTENPAGLEARKASAKALRSAECSASNVTVGELKARLGEVKAASSRCCMQAVLLLVLPAKEKAWAALDESEISLAQELGVTSAQGWNDRDSEIFAMDWAALSEQQRSTAKALGFNKTCWRTAEDSPKAAQEPSFSGPWALSWAELSAAECAAAETLGLTQGSWQTRGAWEALRREAGGVWEKSWAQLSESEHEAADALLSVSADSWDEASWEPKGAWQRQWAQLTQDEREAAAELGISGASAWDAAFGGRERKGQGLTGVWERSWAQLQQGERLAAKRLGIRGAGAWDKSKAQFSVERKLAQLTAAEQEAMMKEWVKQTYGIGA